MPSLPTGLRPHLGHSHSRNFPPKADMLAASSLIALLNRKFRSVTGAPRSNHSKTKLGTNVRPGPLQAFYHGTGGRSGSRVARSFRSGCPGADFRSPNQRIARADLGKNTVHQRQVADFGKRCNSKLHHGRHLRLHKISHEFHDLHRSRPRSNNRLHSQGR